MNPLEQTGPELPRRPAEGQDERRAHTYQDDLNHAMDVTEAPMVQEMLRDAREREAFAGKEIQERGEKKVYSLASILFLLLTVGIIAYGTYYYAHLTVKVQPTQSVGVFPVTSSIVVGTTTVQQLFNTYGVTQQPGSVTLPTGKPTLVNLVTDTTTNTLLTNSQLYSFIGASVPEPLQSVISVVRLGMINTGNQVLPFLIMSVQDPEAASREFAIAEPNLLQLFGPALNVNPATIPNSIGGGFQSQYFYNLPVRTLNKTFFYGYANTTTIVIATDPSVLKAVYDALINQH